MAENNQKILIVDDSRIVRVALKKILKASYDVTEAEDGLVALKKLFEEDFDLIVTDLEMPSLNGFALIEKIRYHAQANIKYLPILVISGEELKKEDTKALNMGATDCLIRPFKSDEVRKSISALLRLSNHHRQERENAGEVNQDAHVDKLTGLGNLSHFHMRGEQELAFAKRHNNKLTVALIQFDRLNIHHSLLGEKVSYQLVKQAGKFIVDCARTEDTVARIKEDTFGVILSMCNILEAKAMVDRLMKRVHETCFKLGTKKITFTVSIGVSSANAKKVDHFDAVVQQAITNLEKALAAGGDTIILDGETKNKELPVWSLDNLLDLSLNQLLEMAENNDKRIKPYLTELSEKLNPLLKS